MTHPFRSLPTLGQDERSSTSVWNSQESTLLFLHPAYIVKNKCLHTRTEQDRVRVNFKQGRLNTDRIDRYWLNGLIDPRIKQSDYCLTS